MDTTRPFLPAEIESVVSLHQGGPVSVAGASGDHVVMSLQVFREMMGVGDEEAFADSVAKLKESLAEAASGRTISLQEARERLVKKYGA
jgi:hypothetical protein